MGFPVLLHMPAMSSDKALTLLRVGGGPIPLKRAVKFGQGRRDFILAAEDRFAVQGPVDPAAVPAHPTIRGAVVIVGAFVADLGVGLQRHEPMGKAFRHPELLAIFETEFHTHPLPIAGGPTPDIDGHIIKRTAPAPDQFGLRMRGRLKVQSAYCANLL